MGKLCSTGGRLPSREVGIGVAVSPLSLPPANWIRYRIIDSAVGVLRVSTLWFSVTITMNIDINIGIHGGAIILAMVVLAGGQVGLDIVTVSPGSVSRRGKRF